MAFQPGANLYTQSFGSRPENLEVSHIDVRDPNPNDIYPVSKTWLNRVTGAYWVLGNLSTSNGITRANWFLLTDSNIPTLAIWPPSFIEGGELTWDASGGPPAVIHIAPLQCVDSTATFNITVSNTQTIGTSNTQSPGWVNGDPFDVVVFADSTNTNAPIYKFVRSGTTPVPPSGYNVYRIIGWVLASTVSTPSIAAFWQSGSSNERTYMYDNSESALNLVTNGNALAGSPGLVNCAPVISPRSFSVYMNSFYSPSTGGNEFAIASTGFNGGMFFGSGDVENLYIAATTPIMVTDANRQLNYYVDDSMDMLSLKLIGFIETL